MKRLLILVLAACGNTGPAEPGAPDAPASPAADAPETPAPPLEVRALGVQGFMLRYGDDSVMTAPMFTRQNLIEVGLGVPLPPDEAAIDAGLAGLDLSQLRAVISGHAHYDHLLDVAPILLRAPTATAYTNLSGRNMLAALAPERPAGCTNTPATPIARSRIVALDDALASRVDYTNCPQLAPPGAPLGGEWVDVPGSRVRVRAFCSMHPDQIGPFHFGEGSVDSEQCELPPAAAEWLEGRTLAFLIDFLDENGAPTMRVFYQDAPGNAPIGEVPAAILAERRVDLALLCVGSSNAVENQPTAIIENLDPRFAFSGHWEDFFQDADATPQPIPFLDLPAYVQKAEAALPGAPDAPLTVDGNPITGRHVLVQPGSDLRIGGILGE